MSDYGAGNVYYSPENFGLKTIAEIDYSSGNYEFDLRVVWQDKTGAFYTARDSGCSCPIPFEDYHGLPSLDRLDMPALIEEVRKGGNEWRQVTPGKAMDFIAAVERAIGATKE